MSLPNHYRELLLSAALDGALSAEEQADFDREIVADASFARQFEELQLLRADLKSAFATAGKQKISADATNRIFAALAEVDRTTSTKPATSVVRESQLDENIHGDANSRQRWIAAGLALAASVMLLATLVPTFRTDTPLKNSIANLNQADPSKNSGDDQNREAETAPVSAPRIDADNLAANESPAVDLESRADEPGKVMGIKPLEEKQSDAPVDRMASTPSRDDQMPATSDPAASQESGVDRQPLNVVLVLSLEMTPAGRDQLALQEALRATDIRLGGDSVMGQEVVSHLQDANVIATQPTAEESSARLFFVEASAKRIDRFMSYLMSHPEWFASIGMSIASEPPLLAAVGELREIDPTKVRQDQPMGLAKGIVGRDREAVSIDPAYPFIPLSSDVVDSGLLQSSLAPPDDGQAMPSGNVVDDFPSQLLLLVK